MQINGSIVLYEDNDHGDTSFDSLKTNPIDRPIISKPVLIGDNVWIGESAMILKGVNVGKNSIYCSWCNCN